MSEINSLNCSYTELGHTAEIGLSLQADTAANLFICAARAMFHLTHPQPADNDEEEEWRQITLSAQDQESLLIDWLSELLYLYETTGEVYDQFHVKIWEPTFLEATVTGRRRTERPAMHIKAVTYHQLEVVETTKEWQARIFFDI